MGEVRSMSPAADEEREKLKELIDQKRGKGGTTQLEAKQFTDAWVALTKTVGVNDDTVALLYDGFKFAASEPMYRYVSESKSKTAYISLFSAKPTVANDQGIAFKVAINLFALELSSPTMAEGVRLLVHFIPKLSVNKDGKAFGTLGRSIGKILIKPLTKKRIHPDIHLSRKDASSILSIIGEPVEAYGKNPKVKSVERSAAISLLAWLRGQAEDQTSSDVDNASPLREQQPSQTEHIAGASTIASVSPQREPSSKPAPRAVAERPVRVSRIEPATGARANTTTATTEQTADKTVESSKSDNAPSTSQLQEHGMPEVIAFLTAYQSEFEALKVRCERTQAERREALNRISVLEQQLKSAGQENSELRDRVTSLAGRCSDLQSELNSQKEANESMRGDLEAAEEMLSTIDSRDTRQADESTRRLARELKVEYEDFMDAAELPMSTDLGENMRDQLRSVFQIIKENGIEL